MGVHCCHMKRGRPTADCTYFSNRDCEYYPCHGIADQNCLFCYCPLYFLECGGKFTLTAGIKDCTACDIVHREGGYDFVLRALKDTRRKTC